MKKNVNIWISCKNTISPHIFMTCKKAMENRTCYIKFLLGHKTNTSLRVCIATNKITFTRSYMLVYIDKTSCRLAHSSNSKTINYIPHVQPVWNFIMLLYNARGSMSRNSKLIKWRMVKLQIVKVRLGCVWKPNLVTNKILAKVHYFVLPQHQRH